MSIVFAYPSPRVLHLFQGGKSLEEVLVQFFIDFSAECVNCTENFWSFLELAKNFVLGNRCLYCCNCLIISYKITKDLQDHQF